MNKKIITGLIVVMGISILGIITVQVVWMKNAISVKTEQFDRGVSDALNYTVGRLEVIHDVMMLNLIGSPDSSLQIKRHLLLPPPSRGSRPGHTPRRPVVFRKSPGREEARVEVKWERKGDSSGENRSEIVIVRQDSLHQINTIITKGMVALDSLTFHTDTDIVVNPVIDRKVHLRAENLKSLALRAATEIAVLDTPRINREELELVLAEELNNRSIPISFQYGVFRDSSLLYASENPDTLALQTSPLQTNLFPNHVFRQNVRLALYFPEGNKFIYRSISWLLAASFLFSLVILLTFGLSLFFLLRQKKISEMKADFVNNMTHEFKTPIATISVAADSILSGKVMGDRDKLEYFAQMIKKENQRMNRQVEDILTIAKLEKKEFDFRWEKANLHDILTEVCDVARVQVEQRGGKILVVQEAMNAVVRADRQHLANVLFNLIDNGNKYSPDIPEITIRTSNCGHDICIAVTDRGSGMSKQVQSRIFERFYRQAGGNVHNVKGFGLGLSYAKAIVDAHHGTIRVSSDPGKGSTFTVTLPAVGAKPSQGG